MVAKKDRKFLAIIKNRCPSCHHAQLYQRYLIPHEQCPECSYPLGDIISGDGPAVLVVFLAGAMAAIITLLLYYSLNISLWMMLIVWVVSACMVSLLSLPILKTAMIFLEYSQNK